MKIKYIPTMSMGEWIQFVSRSKECQEKIDDTIISFFEERKNIAKKHGGKK